MSARKNIPVKKVQYVMNKTGASYEDAERALKKNKEDSDESIRWIDFREKTIFTKLGKAFIGLFFYKLVIKKRYRTFVSIPLWLVTIIFTIIFFVIENSYYYDELEEMLLIIFIGVSFVILISGCDVLLSKKEYDAKIRLKKVQKKNIVNSSDDMEYEIKENSEGEFIIEVNE